MRAQIGGDLPGVNVQSVAVLIRRTFTCPGARAVVISRQMKISGVFWLLRDLDHALRH